MLKKIKAQKYVIYARKSSEGEDKQVASIESQLLKMRELADQLGLNVVEELHESHSAFKEGRSQFNRMMQMINNREVDGVIVWKLSRIARNPLDAGIFINELQKENIKHVRTIDKDWYPEDNVLMMYVEFGLTNQFSKDLSVDTNRGLERKASLGWYPYAALPLGYEHSYKKQESGYKKVLIDEKRFNKVRLIFKTLLKGGHSGESMYTEVKKQIRLTGRNGKVISRSAFYRLISNPFYYGEYEFPSHSGTFITGKHRPIITKKEWDQIQSLIHGGRAKAYNIKHEASFRGLFVCSTCGCSITSDPIRTKTLSNGKEKEYEYYHCTKKRGECNQKYLRVESLKAQIEKILFTYSDIPKPLIEWAMKKLLMEKLKKDGVNIDQKANILKDIAKANEKQNNLLDLCLSGSIGNTVYISKKDEIKAEIAELNRDLDGIKDPSEDFLNRAEHLQEDIISKFMDGDKIKQKEILYSIGSNPQINNKKLEITANPYLAFLSSAPKALKEKFGKFETQEVLSNWSQIGDVLQENSKWGHLLDSFLNFKIAIKVNIDVVKRFL